MDQVYSMKTRLVTLLMCVFLTGCAFHRDEIKYPAGTMLPFEAIQRAAYAAPRPIFGVFWLRVQATGTGNGEVYLNSEQDYHDQRNITVVILPAVARVLEQRLGGHSPAVFMHKSLLVRGAARRVTVYFSADGQPSTKYYYQTHINVTLPRQIVFKR
jgi:hypothetical protein